MLKVKVISGWNEVKFETKLQQFLNSLSSTDSLKSIQYSTGIDPEADGTYHSALVMYVSND